MFLRLLPLLAVTAFAQTVSRGDALRHREFQTYADMDLYVDAVSGDDSYPCSVTLPCASFLRAWSIVPYFIPHEYTVNINIAAGTYNEGLALLNRRVEGVLNIIGATTQCGAAQIPSATWSPASVTAATSLAYVQMQPGPALTANALRGCVLTVVGGTGWGETTRIRSNTTTQLQVSSSFTSTPTTGSTIALTQPAAVFTGIETTDKISAGAKLTGGGLVTISNVAAGANASKVIFAAGPRVQFNDSNFTVGFEPQLGIPTSVTLQNAYVQGAVVVTAAEAFNFNGLVYCSSSCGTGFTFSGPGSTLMRFAGAVDGPFTTAAIQLARGAEAVLDLRTSCDIGTPAKGLLMTHASATGTWYSTDCTEGGTFTGQSYVQLSGGIAGGTPYGVTVSAGSSTYFSSDPFSTNTLLRVDSTDVMSATVADAGYVTGARSSSLAFIAP